jgi:LysM repeat protein
MKIFRLRREPESGEEEREFILDTDAEAQDPAQDTPEAEGVLLQEDDPLDPNLLDIFHAAKNEVEESTPPSGLADIPVQDLLSDLVGVSYRLHATSRVRAEPGYGEAPDLGPEPSEEGNAAEAAGSESPQATGPPRTGYRRYALHGLALGLALAAAIGGLMGAGRPARTEQSQGLPAQSQTGYLKSPLLVTTVPDAVTTPDGQAEAKPEATPEATLEPAPEVTPEPTPELQPAYFLYTVQPGDTVSAIAAVFSISPDYILWNNPDVIKDPSVLQVGQELLIPNVDGMIYCVRSGDTLSDIAARYQIDVQSILAFAPNGLTSPDNAIEGMVLILPKASPTPPPPSPPAATKTPDAATSPTATPTPTTATPTAAPTPMP